MTAKHTDKPRPRRRWRQFTVRTLLLLTLVVAVGSSWLAVKLQQVRERREAVAALRSRGVLVTYSHEWDPFVADPQAPGPKWLRVILGDDFFASIYQVSAFGCDMTDDDMVYLKDLTDLSILDLSDTRVTKIGLTHLQGLTSLRVLLLRNTQVTEPEVESLKKVLPHTSILH